MIILDEMFYMKLSKEVSYALRHRPWEYELELDEEGFVPISQLLSALNESGKYPREITIDDLSYITLHSEKRRHEIRNGKIRALYGHSVPVRILKTPGIPPLILYHGTTHKALPLIMEEGILPMSRQYVHLSVTREMAVTVGKRRDGNPVILKIDAKSAAEDGIIFYAGNENVWLCDAMPVKYIKITEE